MAGELDVDVELPKYPRGFFNKTDGLDDFYMGNIWDHFIDKIMKLKYSFS